MSSAAFPFNREQRLTRKSQFDVIYKEGTRKTSGPLLIHVLGNTLPHCRLGISVSKQVGNAVKRNKIKRRCREAFRISQKELPKSVDVLLTIRPHEVLSASEYATLIIDGLAR